MGGLHNVVEVDLQPILEKYYQGKTIQNMYVHFTQECGNDNLMGLTELTGGEPSSPTPEPATMLLLGTGLVGLAGTARRRKKNQA